MNKVQIDEKNVSSYIGKTIRAEKQGEVLEGKVVGLGDSIVTDSNGQPVRTVRIENESTVMDFHPPDGWKVTLN
jgi:hypothetical protein